MYDDHDMYLSICNIESIWNTLFMCVIVYVYDIDDEACHKYEWVVSHIWMNHVTHMSESCHTYEWIMSHVWMSPVTHMNESCHTHEWVMSHTWMSHIKHMNESCHTYQRVTPLSQMDLFVHELTHQLRIWVTSHMVSCNMYQMSHVTPSKAETLAVCHEPTHQVKYVTYLVYMFNIVLKTRLYNFNKY